MPMAQKGLTVQVLAARPSSKSSGECFAAHGGLTGEFKKETLFS